MSENKAHTFEERVVRCDGREYRVTRTARCVALFDARGNVLKKSPKDRIVTLEPITVAGEDDWCGLIRRFRGEGQ